MIDDVMAGLIHHPISEILSYLVKCPCVGRSGKMTKRK